jgi:coenzyme F420-dependent glucose-6-phosphate dehydrogenase
MATVFSLAYYFMLFYIKKCAVFIVCHDSCIKMNSSHSSIIPDLYKEGLKRLLKLPGLLILLRPLIDDEQCYTENECSSYQISMAWNMWIPGMAQICYHASHEQFSPSHLLQLVKEAEHAGFDGIHSSDHFHPWSVRQGQSGFAFSWVAAALQATTLPFSMICIPGQRYHPAIAAQAIATLAEMFPGRISFEMGSGEAINEVITGDPWPSKEVRNERLEQSVEIIRNLLGGEEVTFNGHVRVKHARLYTRPSLPPSLFAAAVSEKTCRWAAQWADGLITTADSDIESTRNKVAAFQNNGGQGKPVCLQLGFSYARSEQVALEGAWDQWRSNILPREKLASFQRVEEFDEAGITTTKEEVAEAIPIFTSMDQLKARIGELSILNPHRIILHNVNRLQEEFIRDYGLFRT